MITENGVETTRHTTGPCDKMAIVERRQDGRKCHPENYNVYLWYQMGSNFLFDERMFVYWQARAYSLCHAKHIHTQTHTTRTRTTPSYTETTKKCQPKQQIDVMLLLLLPLSLPMMMLLLLLYSLIYSKFICWCDKVTLGFLYDLLHCLCFRSVIWIWVDSSWWWPLHKQIHHSVQNYVFTWIQTMRLFVVRETTFVLCYS